MSLSILGDWEALWHKGLGGLTVPVLAPETGTVTGTVSVAGGVTVPVWAPETGTVLEGTVPVLAPETGTVLEGTVPVLAAETGTVLEGTVPVLAPETGTVLGGTVPVLVPETGTVLRVESGASLSKLAGILSKVSSGISSFVPKLLELS